MHKDLRAEQQKNAERFTSRAGYARGGAVADDEKQDRAMVKKAVAEHEEHDHKGEAPTKLRIKRGGKVDGAHPAARLDKRARGGQVGKGKAPVNITVNAGGGGQGQEQMAEQAGMQKGMQMGAVMGARAAAAKMGGGAPPPGAGPMPPPGGMPPMGAPPPGAPPMMPHPPMAGPPGAAPMRAKGGRVNLTAGSRGAAGRIEKNAAEGGDADRGDLVKVRGHKRRKAGGAV